MNSGPRRDALCFLGLVSSASIVVAVALPHSPAAPLISAFIPVAALLVLTPFLGRSIWRGLGLNRAGFRLGSGRRPSPSPPSRPLSVTRLRPGSV